MGARKIVFPEWRTRVGPSIPLWLVRRRNSRLRLFQFVRRRNSLSRLLQLLAGTVQIPLCGVDFRLVREQVISQHKRLEGGTVRFDRQIDRCNGQGSERQHFGHARFDRMRLVRLAGVAADVQVGRGVQVRVEDARQPVSFQIDLARHGVEPNLVRFEKRAQSIVVLLRDRIVLVVVAFCTVHRQPKEGLRRVLDGVVQPSRSIEQKVASRQKPGRAERLVIGRRDFVGRQHLGQHAVVSLVVVQGLDDPIAPMPDVFLAVAKLLSQTVPVGVPPNVHPVTPPAFAIMGTGQ